MIDRHQEAELLRSLSETYMQMVEAAKGKMGKGGDDAMPGGAGVGAGRGGGRAGVWTPAVGAGADKPKGDDEERKRKAAEAAKAERREAARRRREGLPQSRQKSKGEVLQDAGLLGPRAIKARDKRKKLERAKKDQQNN